MSAPLPLYLNNFFLGERLILWLWFYSTKWKEIWKWSFIIIPYLNWLYNRNWSIIFHFLSYNNTPENINFQIETWYFITHILLTKFVHFLFVPSKIWHLISFLFSKGWIYFQTWSVFFPLITWFFAWNCQSMINRWKLHFNLDCGSWRVPHLVDITI